MHSYGDLRKNYGLYCKYLFLDQIDGFFPLPDFLTFFDNFSYLESLVVEFGVAMETIVIINT